MTIKTEIEVLKKLNDKYTNYPYFPQLLNSSGNEILMKPKCFHFDFESHFFSKSHAIALIEAVQILHNNGLIHRDIRPPNLLWKSGLEKIFKKYFLRIPNKKKQLETEIL